MALLNGRLHYTAPDDMDTPLNEVSADKIRCTTVYIHHGSISHLSGSVENKRKIRDKRKNNFLPLSLIPFSLHFDYDYVIIPREAYAPFTSSQTCL